MSNQSNTPVIATVIVGMIIVVGFVGYGYYTTSSNLASLSKQNTDLGQQLFGVNQLASNLNQQVSSLNQQVSNGNQQVSSLAQRTLTVVTMTNTVIMVETTTSVTTATSVSTSTVYPVPDNVTVLFTQVIGVFSYSITAGSGTYTGSGSAPLSIPLTPVFQGETINISASEYGGFGGCNAINTATAELFLNGQVVAQGTQMCNANDIQITYTI